MPLPWHYINHLASPDLSSALTAAGHNPLLSLGKMMKSALKTIVRLGAAPLCAVLLLATLQAQSAKAATAAATAVADNTPLRLGVGLFQPDKEKNDATYRPLADHLAKKLGRKVELRTVSSWEGLAKSLANGETDIGLLGPWGYVLANQASGAQAVATILYDGKPEYYAIMVTHPDSGINTPADLKGKTFAFGDKGSTSGYLIPRHYFMTLGIVPETYFSKVLYTSHQAIETQVSRGVIDAGADYNRNRNAMIEQGLITADQSKIIWRSAPLPNDAVAVSAALYNDKAFVALLQAALVDIGPALAAQPNLLPAHYTGFVARDNLFYKPIRDAGLATGTLTVK
jgi:phosphonate transport system substrate-binding protein